jgi:hypothetical protein
LHIELHIDPHEPSFIAIAIDIDKAGVLIRDSQRRARVRSRGDADACTGDQHAFVIIG